MWSSEGEGEGGSYYSMVGASANAAGDQMTAEDEAQRQVQRLSRGPETEGPEGLREEAWRRRTQPRNEKRAECTRPAKPRDLTLDEQHAAFSRSTHIYIHSHGRV